MTDDACTLARQVLEGEARSITAAAGRLDAATFGRAVGLVAECRGKVLMTGVGTSGIIARKIAATLTSTGSPSVFLHPSDALHGGLGVVGPDDVVVAVSHSGETAELLVILPYLRHRQVPLVGILGNARSTLAEASNVMLDAGVDQESGHLGLAPTDSSTVALAMGDALAMGVAAAKSFSAEDFALNHPSGRLGRRLTLSVVDVAPGGLASPSVPPDATLLDAVAAVSTGGVGAVAVVDDRRVVGIVTDGDVRRALHEGLWDVKATSVLEVMTTNPVVVAGDTLAFDALQTMEDRPSQISVLPVVDPDTGTYLGMLRVHDLIRAGI